MFFCFFLQNWFIGKPKLSASKFFNKNNKFSHVGNDLAQVKYNFAAEKIITPRSVNVSEYFLPLCIIHWMRTYLKEVFCSIFLSKSGKFQVERDKQSTLNLICRIIISCYRVWGFCLSFHGLTRAFSEMSKWLHIFL